MVCSTGFCGKFTRAVVELVRGYNWRQGYKAFTFLVGPFDRPQLQVVTASFSAFGSEEPNLWGNGAFGNIRTPPNLVIFGNSDGPG